jgi:hypothetical protein
MKQITTNNSNKMVKKNIECVLCVITWPSHFNMHNIHLLIAWKLLFILKICLKYIFSKILIIFILLDKGLYFKIVQNILFNLIYGFFNV